MAFSFTKWQGCGNDFVLVNGFSERLDEEDLGALAQKICDRHYGIGADGLILVLPSKAADFRMRILNADGSEAEMCGNGIRCFAGVVHDEGLSDKEEFTVETGAGILVPRLQLADGKLQGVRVDMGEPTLIASSSSKMQKRCRSRGSAPCLSGTRRFPRRRTWSSPPSWMRPTSVCASGSAAPP